MSTTVPDGIVVSIVLQVRVLSTGRESPWSKAAVFSTTARAVLEAMILKVGRESFLKATRVCPLFLLVFGVTALGGAGGLCSSETPCCERTHDCFAGNCDLAVYIPSHGESVDLDPKLSVFTMVAIHSAEICRNETVWRRRKSHLSLIIRNDFRDKEQGIAEGVYTFEAMRNVLGPRHPQNSWPYLGNGGQLGVPDSSWKFPFACEVLSFCRLDDPCTRRDHRRDQKLMCTIQHCTCSHPRLKFS